MSNRFANPKTMPAPRGYTQVVETTGPGRTVYLSGQVPDDSTQDIRGQTAQVLATVDRLLVEAGTDNAHILMAQIFLADMADFAGMNEVWDDWVAPGDAPPRATVQAKLANPAYRIEIDGVRRE